MEHKTNTPFIIRDVTHASAEGVKREYRVYLGIANIIDDPESFHEVIKNTATIIAGSTHPTIGELFGRFSQTVIETKRAFDAILFHDVFPGEGGSCVCTARFYALAINRDYPTHLVANVRMIIRDSTEWKRQVLWFPMNHRDARARKAFQKYVLEIQIACREILKSHGAVRAEPIYADVNGVIFLHSSHAWPGKLIAILNGGAVVVKTLERNIRGGVPLPEGKLLGWDALQIDPHNP